VPPGGPTRTERRKRRTIDAILAAAEAVYAERGFGGGTVEEIAERADVAVGSVYNHFGSKGGLELAVAERAALADESFMDRAYTADRDAAEEIRAAGLEFLAFYREHPDFFRLLAFPHLASGDGGEETRERVASRVAAQNARLVQALRAGIEEGSVRPLDPEAVATVLWSAWSGIIALAWRPDSLRVDLDELEHLIEVAAEIVVDGIAKRAP
jgi:TetR/AcrR family transcriptional regulator